MITTLIHTHNEEKNIQECIDSARLLTENIKVIDMESTDGTISIAQAAGVPVINFPFSQYVEPAREFGIRQVETDWVFILDADERISEELAREIAGIISNKQEPTRYALSATHYKVPRKNIFGRQKWLKHGGWSPDHQMRLIRVKDFKSWPSQIHSTPTISGSMGFLTHPIIHYFHTDITEMVNKTMVYENIEAQLLYDAGRPVSTLIIFRKFAGELYRRLVLKMGFLDGVYGIIESFYQAYSKTITYLFLFEKYQLSSKKKIALYNPYLKTMGGGERLILSILQVLEESGYEVTVFWDENLTKNIEAKLNLTFQNLKFKKNIFTHSNIWQRYKELSQYEMLFYVTDGSYFFSSAKKNYVFSMVPDNKLYQMNVLNKIKLHNYSFITISEFSKSCLTRLNIPSEIIYPYLPARFFEPLASPKEKIILNVGRFFKQLHSKRQDIALQWFIDLQKKYPQFAEYKLILAGSCMPEDEEYMRELHALASANHKIEFQVNKSFDDLIELYNRAEFYWHMAGYAVHEEKHPERTEHLGITPMEAMARGCITCAFRAGGPKEIINDGATGYLFSTQEELFEKMNEAQKNAESIQHNAIEYTQSHFSYEVFKQRVIDIILTK